MRLTCILASLRSYDSITSQQITRAMTPFVDAEELKRLLAPVDLVEAIKSVFSLNTPQPSRVHLSVPTHSNQDVTLLLMPAWNQRYIGIKLATIHPDNAKLSIPSVHASYVLKDARTGQELAMFDGNVLTKLRTAATSALASSYLSRPDSSTLLMMGAGSLAYPLVLAHAAVRPIERVICWNRSATRRDRLVDELQDTTSLEVSISHDPESALDMADIVSCATLSRSPLFYSEAVRPGTHIDLVGAYTATMRETDTALITRSDIFVDTLEGAQNEAGDLIQASIDSDWTFENIVSDLPRLCSGKHLGRRNADAITVFKSVGASIEDLAAAGLAWERLSSKGHKS